MAARDKIHDAVKAALLKDGWTITDDPYVVQVDDDKLAVDLAAERLIALQRNTERIAVEIKTFAGPSPLSDFEKAMGQFLLYMIALEESDPDRRLYLAVAQDIFADLFPKRLIKSALERLDAGVVVIDVLAEEVVQWIT